MSYKNTTEGIMIETITAPLARFDLQGFLDGYRDFYRSWAGGDDADSSVSVMRRHGDIPEPLYEDRDLAGELLERGWLLFFPMHEPLMGETARCIDGVERDVDEFEVGSADQYGWVVEVSDGQVQLHPALYEGGSGPTPSLDLQGRCGVLDDCMEGFARRFLKDDRDS